MIQGFRTDDKSIEIDHGIATLMGAVENLKVKLVAEEVVRNTLGVFNARNHIKVRRGLESLEGGVATMTPRLPTTRDLHCCGT
jgi:hypothetical protein